MDPEDLRESESAASAIDGGGKGRAGTLAKGTRGGRSRRWYGRSCDALATIARPAAGLLRGFDTDAFLLARICNVADGGALHVALPTQVVELGSVVHRAPIVPNDQVVDAPAMRVNELTLRGVRDELVDQCAASCSDIPKMRPACDAR